MNPRQRRGVLLMILAALGAVAVFVALLSYVGQVRAQVGNMRPVLQLTQDVAANRTITDDMVQQVQTPAKWTPETVIRDLADLQGTVTATKLSEGAYLQRGMLIPAPDLEPGQREIAILIDAVTGVAGKIEPGSVVDIYATFQGSGNEPQPCSVRVMSSVRVISVGELQTQETEGGQVEQNQVVPLTFALSPQSVNRLMYAESFSQTLRLARVSSISEDSSPPVEALCTVPKTDRDTSSDQSDSSGSQGSASGQGDASSGGGSGNQGGGS